MPLSASSFDGMPDSEWLEEKLNAMKLTESPLEQLRDRDCKTAGYFQAANDCFDAEGSSATTKRNIAYTLRFDAACLKQHDEQIEAVTVKNHSTPLSRKDQPKCTMKQVEQDEILLNLQLEALGWARGQPIRTTEPETIKAAYDCHKLTRTPYTRPYVQQYSTSPISAAEGKRMHITKQVHLYNSGAWVGKQVEDITPYCEPIEPTSFCPKARPWMPSWVQIPWSADREERAKQEEEFKKEDMHMEAELMAGGRRCRRSEVNTKTTGQLHHRTQSSIKASTVLVSEEQRNKALDLITDPTTKACFLDLAEEWAPFELDITQRAENATDSSEQNMQTVYPPGGTLICAHTMLDPKAEQPAVKPNA